MKDHFLTILSNKKKKLPSTQNRLFYGRIILSEDRRDDKTTSSSYILLDQ